MSDDALQRQRNEEKKGVVEAIRQALSDLSLTTGQLGRWQRHNLAHALANTERGLFGVALTCADMAAMSSGYSEALIRPEPAIDRMSLRDFDKWLQAIEQEPAPLHPIFGAMRS